MTLNEVCELDFFEFLRRWGGIYTAFVAHKALMEQEGVTVYVNSLRHTDITHIHSFGPFALYKLLTGRPSVVSTHMVPQTIIGSLKAGNLLYPLVKVYLRYFYNRADTVVALSPFAKKELEDLGVKKKIVVISNPINTAMFHKNQKLREEARKEYGIADKQIVVVGVGQMIPRKGIADFISVAKILPDYTFVWIGGEPVKGLLPDSNNLLKNLPPNLILAGLQSYEKMPKFYNMADIFFFPSFQEVASMVIIEAAACNLPLVVRDLPQYEILYQDGYTGCGNVEEFSSAIQKLATDKKAYQKALEGSIRLAAKFSMSEIGQKFLALYTSLMNKS